MQSPESPQQTPEVVFMRDEEAAINAALERAGSDPERRELVQRLGQAFTLASALTLVDLPPEEVEMRQAA